MAAVGSSLKSIALRADAIGVLAYELFSPGRDAPEYKAHWVPRDEFTRGKVNVNQAEIHRRSMNLDFYFGSLNTYKIR